MVDRHHTQLIVLDRPIGHYDGVDQVSKPRRRGGDGVLAGG
jgi:hypothetical protein